MGNEWYNWIKSRLDEDFEDFEVKTTQMINDYGSDYNKFLHGDMSESIRHFSRAWKEKGVVKGYFLNNTYVDTLFQYLCTRDMLDSRDGDILIFEFSPFRGWSTYNLLRAVRDSGKESRVKMVSYELSKKMADTSRINLKNRFKNHIASSCLEIVHGDALKGLQSLRDKSVDLMFIDSDHSRKFAHNYIKSGSFSVCKDDAYIHIHDFTFFIKEECPEKYAEPEVVVEYMKTNTFPEYTMGQLFTLLGASNTADELKSTRRIKNGEGKLFTSRNYFIRNDLPKEYWLGGSIQNINKYGIHKNKTWLSGLGLWMFPSATH